MRKLLLVIAVAAGVVWVGLATPRSFAGGRCPERPVSHQALLSIPRIGMRNQPVATELAHGDPLATGPIWDPYYPARPGSGKTMVIDAHDVTPVPCYGAHGPFYNLITIRPGDTARIKWAHVWRTYRFVSFPFARRQCLSKQINDSSEHLVFDTAICAPYNKPMNKKWGTEVVFFRCCWPRYTRRKFLYARAVLVTPKP